MEGIFAEIVAWTSWVSTPPANMRSSPPLWRKVRDEVLSSAHVFCHHAWGNDRQTKPTYQQVSLISDNVSSIYTSGRKCNFKGKGCDAEHLQPININGWFWAGASNTRIPATNERQQDSFWSPTGEWVHLVYRKSQCRPKFNSIDPMVVFMLASNTGLIGYCVTVAPLTVTNRDTFSDSQTNGFYAVTMSLLSHFQPTIRVKWQKSGLVWGPERNEEVDIIDHMSSKSFGKTWTSPPYKGD